MSDAIDLSNDLVTARVHPADGAFDLLNAERRTVLAGATIAIVLADGTTLSSRGVTFQLETPAGRIEDALGVGSSLKAEVDFGRGITARLTLTIYEGRPSIVLACEL